jgi:hypothetical protein
MKNSNNEPMFKYSMFEPADYLAARPKDRVEQRTQRGAPHRR